MKIEKDYIIKIQLFYKSMMKKLQELEKDLSDEDLTFEEEDAMKIKIETLDETLEVYENIFTEILFGN